MTSILYIPHGGGPLPLLGDAGHEKLVRFLKERTRRLIDWESVPFARYCHPREEHLLPLHVCAGMAQSRGEVVFADKVMGKKACAFLWRTT